MSRILTSGFELNSVLNNMEWKTAVGSPTISTSTVRSGTYALRINPSAAAQYVQSEIFTSSESGAVYVRFYLYITTLPSIDTCIAHLSAQGSQEVGIVLKTNGTLQGVAKTNANTIGSPSSALNTGQWYRIEFMGANPGAANGSSEFKLDGSTFASHTNTTPDVDAIDYVRIGSTQSASCDLFYDDVAVNDSNGSAQNSWPGEGKVVHLYPSSDITTNWNSATPHFSKIDETGAPNDATDFIETNSNADLDVFGMQDCSAAGIGASDTINVLHLMARWMDQSSGLPNITFGIYDGTNTDSFAMNQSISSNTYITNNAHQESGSDDHRPLVTIYDTVTGSSALTPGDIDGYQASVLTGDTDTYRISTLWFVVEYIPNAGAPITKNVSDTVTMSEVRAFSITKVRTDSMTMSEVLAKLTGKPRSDSITMSENFTASRVAVKDVSDTVTMAEAFIRSVAKSLLESITMSENFARVGTFLRSLTDSVTPADSVLKSIVLGARVETVTVADDLLAQPAKNLSDSATLADTMVKTPNKAPTESLTLSEVFSRIGTFLRTLTDSITPSEVLNKSLVLAAKTDGVTAADTLSKQSQKNPSDSVTVADTLTKIGTFLRSLTDSVTMSEDFTSLVAIVRTVSDSITAADTMIRQAAKSVIDSISPADTITRVVNYVRTLTDSITMSEVLSKLSTLFRTVSDSVTASDSMVRLVAKQLADTFSLSEIYNRVLTFGRILTDSILLSEDFFPLHRELFYQIFDRLNVNDENGQEGSAEFAIPEFGGTEFAGGNSGSGSAVLFTKLVIKVTLDTLDLRDFIIRRLNGVLIDIWKKIDKTVAAFTKVEKPEAPTYNKQSRTSATYNKQSKPPGGTWTKQPKTEADWNKIDKTGFIS